MIVKGGGRLSSMRQSLERGGKERVGAVSFEDGREGHNPFYRDGGGEGRRSSEVTVDNGGEH
jgi:hypothetical protein